LQTLPENALIGRRSILKEDNMLVLSRHKNEAIVIDGQIKVTIVEIRGNQIRLGIEAPKELAIRREKAVVSATQRELVVL